MSYHNDKIHIQSQIVDVEKMLAKAKGNLFFEVSLQERLDTLKKQLAELPETDEAKITLLFSGDAVAGSAGINSLFAGKTILPIQNLIRMQTAIRRYGENACGKGPAGRRRVSDLYLTSLEKGSFGYELSLLSPKDLFEEEEVAQSIKSVIDLFRETSASGDCFEQNVRSLPPKALLSLKSFFKELSQSNSILKVESGSNYLELSAPQVKDSYARISSTQCTEEAITMQANFKGALIETGKFELIDTLGNRINGDISPDLSQEEIAQYNRDFSNIDCLVTVKKYTTTFNNGKARASYELEHVAPSQNP